LDIGEWLRGLDLQSYEQAFRDNGIDCGVLPHLTVDDLKEIGVHAVGHRRKILEAISLLPMDRAAAQAPASVERRQLRASCERRARETVGVTRRATASARDPDADHCWFSEGSETRDLVEAGALLADLQ
jgi:hypothetical protein